jgi:hypothetical protein
MQRAGHGQACPNAKGTILLSVLHDVGEAARKQIARTQMTDILIKKKESPSFFSNDPEMEGLIS